MRWTYFILLQSILILIVIGAISLHKDKAVIVKTPPEELAQWYKPQSKRHVWLHNMFKLRREMQAVQFYAETEEDTHLKKWFADLSKHYLKIGEMAPSWHKKLDLQTLSTLTNHVENSDYQGVISSVAKLQENCDACHTDYQAITALIYRSGDFASIDIEPDVSFKAHMQKLTQQVNQIKIASDDGMTDLALSALGDFKLEMSKLGEVCADCHKGNGKSYPDAEMNATLLSLEENLKTGTAKQKGRDLGMLAVQACARCHGTHRLASGVKSLLTKEPNLTELLKH